MRTILYLIVLIFGISSIHAQEPLIKFYLQDGSEKDYNIEDIEEIGFIHSNLSYSMYIYQNGSTTPTAVDIRTIDRIYFENITLMKIVQGKKEQSYTLKETDSIVFIFNTCTEIQIGSQVWKCKNLDVDRYRNGEPIRHAQTQEEWSDAWGNKEGAWCYYYNDPANGEIYGKLYNWYAVSDPRGLAPEGWHIPTDKEWKELEMCLGMSQAEADNTGSRGTDQGSQLAGRADLWVNGGLENNLNFGTSGFSALPGGWRYLDGAFYSIGSNGYWWSATELHASNAWYRYLYYDVAGVIRSLNSSKERGFSVRCVRD